MREKLQIRFKQLLSPKMLQIILFFFLILPVSLSMFSIFEFILIIILELIGIIALLYKKPKKVLYLILISQLFVFLYLLIIFHFSTIFQIQNPSVLLIGSFLFITSFIYGVLSSYIIFQERIVKPTLFILASSTALIVILMVVFIAFEAAPALQENDPIQFITGTHFNPFYSYTKQHTLNITTVIDPYAILIESESDSILLQPNISDRIIVNITNLSPQNNTVNLFATSSSAQVMIDEKIVTIAPFSSKRLNLTITPSTKGLHYINITAQTLGDNKQHSKEIICVATPYAFKLTPHKYSIKAYEFAQNILGDFTLINKGEKNDTYTVTIQTTEEFRPYVMGGKWNFTTGSVSYTLEPTQEVQFTIQANLVQLVPGKHSFLIFVSSQNDPSLIQTSEFQVIYQEQTTLVINNTKQYITQNDSAIYEILLKRGETDSLGIFLKEETPGWIPKVYYANGTVILDNYGTTNITLNGTSLTIYLSHHPIHQQNGSIGNLTIGVIDWGTKPSFGILTFIIGTLLTTLIAVLIATPLGLGCAILLAEYTPSKIRAFLRPLYELLAGIPSVIYGLWGFMTFGPFLKKHVYPHIANTLGQHISIFSPTSYMGSDILTASIVLAIMILPIIITLSEDAIRSVRRELKEGSLAMGATRWQTLSKIILPQAKSGIITSVILGTGRAIGETMAVLMVMGLVVRIPTSLFDATSTMTGVIANNFGWAFDYPSTRHALFAIAFILFIMVFILNIIIARVEHKSRIKNAQKQMFSPKNFLIKILSNKTKKTNKTNFNNISKLDNRTQNEKKFTVIEYIKPEKPQKMVKSYNSLNLYKKTKSSTRKALFIERMGIIIIILCALFVTIMLFYILSDIIFVGLTSMKPEFLFEVERMAGLEGGFLNAIVGSIYLVGIALLFATPLSIGAAIYIQEYAKKSNIMTRIIMFTSDTLASTPSIVFGAFGFMFFVITLRFRWSLLAGGLTLGIMIIPLMLRSSIEAIKTVSEEFREGSYALGATKWQTIVNIVIPTAATGIASGTILAIGRAIGETAAVLLTAGYAMEIPTSILHQAASMPNMIFNYFEFATKKPFLMNKVYSVAFVLIIIILILNFIARLIGNRYSKMLKN